MHTYITTFVHTNICTYMYTYIHAYIHTRKKENASQNIHILMYTDTHLCVQVDTLIHVCERTQGYIH